MFRIFRNEFTRHQSSFDRPLIAHFDLWSTSFDLIEIIALAEDRADGRVWCSTSWNLSTLRNLERIERLADANREIG
jgi:hypothetical protein